MKIYRLSYTNLNLWHSGNWQDAVAGYLGENTFQNKEMYAGQSLHKMWETEVKQYNTIPRVFGGSKIGDVIPEHKITKIVRLDDDTSICFVGVLDLWEKDTKIARDWKTGKVVFGVQYLFYQYLQPDMKKFVYHLFNQATQEVSISVKHCNQATYQAGEEWALTNGLEFVNYLRDNNIFNQESHQKSVNVLNLTTNKDIV